MGKFCTVNYFLILYGCHQTQSHDTHPATAVNIRSSVFDFTCTTWN